MTLRTGGVPRLEPGDRLTRAEFERRYEAMPELKKAELIEGVVYVGSTVTYSRHGEPHARISYWLLHYAAGTPGIAVADNTTVRLDLDNEPQPDLMLRVVDPARAQTSISVEGYVEGAPELVVEVTASRASYDLHDKLRAYRRNGVREYVVWRVDDDRIDWFVLTDGEYVRQAPDAGGLLKSPFFPGLWLHVDALLAGDLARVRAAVDRGLAAR